MPCRARVVLLCFVVAAIVSAAGHARAQTVSQSGQLAPERFVNGQDLGQSTRPQNLNPTGVNYSDCEQDMTLQFTINLSGFTGADDLQIWATLTGNCTQTADRGIGTSGATCWRLPGGLSAPLFSAVQTKSFSIRVRDLVGAQAAPPWPTSNYASQGEAACHTQGGPAAVTLKIYFLPVNTSSSAVDGTGYLYSMTADLVGPTAPLGVSIGDGDTLFVVQWTPNADSDTAGYDVFMDPVAGQEDASVIYHPTTAPTSCASQTAPSGSAPGDGGTEAGPDAGDAAVADAASAADAACSLNSNSGAPMGNQSNCPSAALTGGIASDSGTRQTTVVQYDDAGNVIDSGTVISGTGGISTIPASYIVNANSSTGTTVSGLSGSTYTITGLQNGTTYTVAVAAVDGSGNVGLPSLEACDFPAPVNDFWKIYRQDGGRAGGGFCALEAVGAPVGSSLALAGLGAATIAVVRRRRRRHS